MATNMIKMTDELYDYVHAVSDREPAILAELREATEALTPWFRMQITPLQGQFLDVLIRATGAKKVLEIGTFTGYSSLVMATALPDGGRLTTCDISDDYTGLARKYWEKAGVADKITLKLGSAVDSLDALIAEGQAGTYDFMFIDADKPSYPDYWDRGMELVRPGGLLIADNTLFQGTVTDDFTAEKLEAMWRGRGRPDDHIEELVAATEAARVFNRKVHADDRVALSMVPVADGMTFGVKK